MQNDENRSQTKPLTIEYRGRRGGIINLTIEDFPDEVEIRQQMQDPDFMPEWKRGYLEDLYNEYRDNENHRKKGVALTDESMSQFLYSDAAGHVVHIAPNIDRTGQTIAINPTPQFVEDIETQAQVEELLSFLNENQREIIEKCVIEGMSFSELALQQGKDESAVRKAAKRALNTLKRKLEQAE